MHKNQINVFVLRFTLIIYSSYFSHIKTLIGVMTQSPDEKHEKATSKILTLEQDGNDKYHRTLDYYITSNNNSKQMYEFYI